MVSFRAAVAPLAILAASSASLVDALPSPVRLSGSVPSVATEAELQRNVVETFAKLEAHVEQLEQRDVARETQIVPPAREKRRLAKKCNAGSPKVSLDTTVAEGLGLAIDGAVGTPAQPVNFIFDTGSYDMLVQSTTANGAAAFDPSKSTTYASNGQAHQFNYVTSSYTAKLATDTLTIAGLSVPGQIFGLIEDKSGTPGVSGTIGLGLKTQGELGENNFFSNLVAAGKVAENRIGLYISPVGSSGAEVTLGGVDSSRYTGKLQTLENKPLQGHWTLSLKQAFHNGNYVPTSNVVASVLIDSGSSVSFLPRAFVTALHKKIPGAVLDDANSIELAVLGGKFKVDRWTVPCTTTDTVSFQFNMPRPVATMPKWEIPANALVGPPVAEDSNMCATTLWGVDIPYPTGPVGILGIPFLRGQYTVFDYGSTDSAPTISFAKLA